jgi:septal ring-binding cell division protein DamX
MKKKEKSLPKKKKPSPKPSPKPSRKRFTFWFFLLFFTSAWMFFLGVLVGRDTAPVHFDIEKLQKELAGLKQAAIEKEERRYKISPKATFDANVFSFYETLKGKKSNVKLYPNKSKKRETPDKKKAAKTLQDSRTSASNKKTDTGRILTIQVASLKDPKAANKLVTKLKKKGYAAYKTTVDISGKGTWHRVRIGYFKNRADAKKTLNNLRKENRKVILMYRKK